RYLANDWNVLFGRSLTEEERAQLNNHLTTLLAQGPVISPVPEDKALVDFHRTRLAATSLPQRIYDRMLQGGVGKDIAEFSVARVAGNNAAIVFTRPSGQPLNKGVPGLFTYDGYHNGFQKALKPTADQLAEEQAWVLGVKKPPKDAATLVRGGEPLLDQVRRLYLNEYAQRWDQFIADIRLVPMSGGITQLIQTARLLSSAESPLPPLMKGLSRETTLLSSSNKGLIDKGVDKGTGLLKDARDAVIGKVAPGAAATGEPIELIVDNRFRSLRQYVATPEGGGKAPLDDTIALIGEVQMMLNAADAAIKSGAPAPPS